MHRCFAVITNFQVLLTDSYFPKKNYIRGNIKGLLTEREVSAVKYQTDVFQ